MRWPDRALRAGEDGVVVGEDGARGALAVQVAVDPGRAGDQAVGGRAGDQLVLVAAHALGGDRETAVLDEAARVDQVVEVLARGARPEGVAFGDGLGPRLVAGEPAALERLGEVVTHAAKTRIKAPHAAQSLHTACVTGTWW